MRSLAAVALSLAVSLPAAAQAASDAEGLRLMKAVREATGGAALDRPEAFRETGVMTRDGQSGTYETFGDLHALRSAGSQTFQGRTRLGGFDGEANWQTGPDGTVARITDPAIVRGERLGTYLTVSGYLYPDRFPATFEYRGRRSLGGRAYEVVFATPRDTDGLELWIDSATHRVAHIEVSSGGEAIKGDVGDYRLVDGTWVGYALDMDVSGQKVSLRLKDFQYIPRAEARLSPPAP